MTSDTYSLSRYLRMQARDDYLAIFHELHPAPIYCTRGEWEKFTNNIAEFRGTPLFQGLIRRKLIVASTKEDQMELESVALRLEQKLNQPTILYLMMAQGCNFACKYCPIPALAKRYGETLLSPEDARAGVDLWREHLRDTYDPSLEYFIIFYGGEPLLNKDVIAEVLEYVRGLHQAGALPTDNLHLMISTNGVLFDERMMELCRTHEVMVVVGIDGPKAVHDSLRVDIDGQGTYDRVIRVVQSLVEQGIRTFASVAIAPHDVGNIKNYAPFFKELGLEKFGFNFLKGRLLLDLVPADMLETYYRNAAKGVIENARHHHGKYFEYQMEKKLVAFAQQDFFPVDCTCYGNQLVIQPDGQISNCPFYKAQLGQVQEVSPAFRIWDTPVVKEWRKRLPLQHDEFRDMDAKSLCGAGCAWSSLELTGNILAVDKASMIFAEEVFNELIWSQFDPQQYQPLLP